jgi:beta-N-acetylhexosaminidase
LNFHGLEAESLWAALSSGREKSIIVSFGSPYFFNEYFQAAEVYINTYSCVSATQKALIKALFGEIDFTGVSPVEL